MCGISSKGLITLFGLLALLAMGRQSPAAEPLKIGITAAMLHDQHGLLQEWQNYLQQRLGRSVTFVQRDRYRDTMDLINRGEMDYAWVCDYLYISLGNQVRLLAVPVYQGRPYYRSYLIVANEDRHTQSISDLKDAVFAYADPYSHTGYFAPRYEMRRVGLNPETLFRRSFFTWSHRKSIEAVVVGLAQGAAVDSFVWESLARLKPEVTARTRVAWKSEEWGFPPFVARADADREEFAAIQTALLGMTEDAEGRGLLAKLNLDGFIPGDSSLYLEIEQMIQETSVR